MATEITDKKLADFENLTPDQQKEVSIYNSEGDVAKFWFARRFNSVVVVTQRAPGKTEKLVGITDYERDYSAEAWIDREAEARAKRVPIIRKEKADAKLKKLIEESKTELVRLTAWSIHGSGSFHFDSPDEIRKDKSSYEIMKASEAEQISAIMEMLRRKGDSYFGGLKLARRFIEQLRPGGMADRIVEQTMEALEKWLIPWAYVAGHLGQPVMMANKPRELTIKLIERHANPRHDDLGFYPEEATVDGVVERVVNHFDDVKPEVLDALTLE